jgi:hypothetical protein
MPLATPAQFASTAELSVALIRGDRNVSVVEQEQLEVVTSFGPGVSWVLLNPAKDISAWLEGACLFSARITELQKKLSQEVQYVDICQCSGEMSIRRSRVLSGPKRPGHFRRSSAVLL